MSAADFTVPEHVQSARLPPASLGAIVLRSVLESFFLIMLLRAVEQIFFGPGTFAAQTIHPFWIVVLIASIQSGIFAGVIAAGLAALLADWPSRPIGVDITDHFLSVAAVPVQWLVVALVVGLFRQMQIRAERRLADENTHLAEANEALAGEVARLDEVFRQLELAAITAPTGTPDASDPLELTAALASATLREIPVRFRAASVALGAPRAYLLVEDGDRHFAGAGDDPVIKGLDELLTDDDGVVRNIASSSGAILVEGRGAPLAVCEVGGEARGDLAALVAIEVGKPLARAPALLAAELLARAVTMALDGNAAVPAEGRDD